MVGANRAMTGIGKVIINTELCPGIYELIIECPEIVSEAESGQFIHVKVKEGLDPVLRRPISISRIFRESGRISLIYQIIGRGTKEMASFKEGDDVDLIGPLGNGFPLYPDRKCAVIGGGMGVAPLLELAASLKECDAYLGFRCSSFKIDEYSSLCRKVSIATEDGSSGSKGYVTDLINNIEDYDVVYTCGPKPMMKRVKELCENKSVKCFVSIEERMGCGIGACLVCACKIKEGDSWHYKKACKDGPVFESWEVDFDD